MRNIPAYAGKTAAGDADSDYWQEHPRVCGENSTAPNSKALSAGTSPRMRGKHLTWVCPTYLDRNIPAYAGKTKITLGEWLIQ